MTLPAFALSKRPIVLIACLCLMAWGCLSYASMPRREDPEYTVRACQVLTYWPGAPVEKVEELITVPLEDEINTLDGIRWIKSENVVGVSSIIVELARAFPGDQVDQMWDKVRARVEKVRMPAPGIRPVVIDDFGDTAILVAAVHQVPAEGEDAIPEDRRYSPREMDILTRRIKDELSLLPGVSKVTRTGILEEVVTIEAPSAAWSQLALSSGELEALLSQRNVLASGGVLDTATGRFSVRPTGDLDAVREIESIIVGRAGHESSPVPVTIGEAGLRVVRGYEDPPRAIARYADTKHHSPAVILSVVMKDGADISTVCASARALFARLGSGTKVLPPDVRVDLVSDISENVEKKIAEFVWNVVGAIVLVVGIVYLMVGMRVSAVMAANIPLVVVGTLALLPLFGIQMEQISIAAMIIALGMLVDNAVQISDQSRRLQQEGMTPWRATLEGSEQLSFPVLIATLTTVAAFLPMLVGLQGSSKEYVYSLPVTLTVTLLLSYYLAMTFCVLLAYWFIRPSPPGKSLSPVVNLWRKVRGGPPPAEGSSNLFFDAYNGLVRFCLKARWPVVGASFAALFLVLALPVGSEFFPKDNRDQFTIDVWLPEGASIAQTDAAARKVEEVLLALSPGTGLEGEPVERLRALGVVVGGGMPRWYLGRTPESPKANYAEIVVRTTDGRLTGRYVKDIRDAVAAGDASRGIAAVAGVRVNVRELMLGPSVDAPIGLRIFGPRQGSGFADIAVLKDRADALKSLLRERPGTYDIHDTWGAWAYQADVEVDPNRANLAGVTSAGVARSLNAGLSGHYLTTFREGDHQVPVHLRLPPEERTGLENLRWTTVEGASGKVLLDSVAGIEMKWMPARIDRRFLQRVIEVRCLVQDGFLANDLVKELTASPEYGAWLAALPPGYTCEIGGELFESLQGESEIRVSILISVICIVLLLVIQFNGIMKPFIIMMTLPLAIIGARLGVYLTDNAMGFMPSLGLLSLFGIVVNAAIIFFDFADTSLKERILASKGSGPVLGLTPEEFKEVLVKAGEVRLMPIAQTTLTTIAGLLPLALAGGPLWEGMSWLLVYGLAIGTLLTLVIVPCLYAILVLDFKRAPIEDPRLPPEGAAAPAPAAPAAPAPA